MLREVIIHSFTPPQKKTAETLDSSFDPAMTTVFVDSVSQLSLPSVTVVIVSDEVSDERSWCDELRVIEAFTSQNYQGKIDIILVENERYRSRFPENLRARFPKLSVYFSSVKTSAALKNLGMAKSTGDLVAVFEADSEPFPDCLSKLVNTLMNYPDADLVTSRTLYRGSERNALRRCLGFLGRGKIEPSCLGEVVRVPRPTNNHAMLMRAEVAKHFPYPEEGSPFVTAHRRNEDLSQAGKKFLLNSEALNIHEFEGVNFEFEFYKQVGFRKMENQAAKSLFKIPLLVFKSNRSMLRHVLSRGLKELKIMDIPIALALCPILPILEIPGMLDSIRGCANTGNRFR